MNPNLSCRVSNESPSNSASNDINIDGVCNKKFFRPTSLQVVIYQKKVEEVFDFLINVE